MFINEPERKTEVISEYDTVVCGGGIAGVSAALASARHGAKTLLIEKEYLLGGLATLGLIAIYLPLSDGCGNQYSTGIAEELFKLSAKHGYIKYSTVSGENKKVAATGPLPAMNERTSLFYDPNVFSVDMERLLLENGVTILYGTAIADTITESGKISHIILNNRDGRTAIKVKTVVDATGDAAVTKLSGENTVKNDEGNIMASWYSYLENGKNHLRIQGFSDGGKPEQILGSDGNRRYSDYSAKAITEYTLNSHLSSVSAFLQKGNVSEHYNMTSVSYIPQLRMTERISGFYTQSIDEIRKEYPDSVGMFANWKKQGDAYELPFRCLYGKTIKNLLCAGRCISSKGDMWDVTRVIPVCAVSGQAAGTAAALFDDFGKADIKILQSVLKADGVKIHEKE